MAAAQAIRDMENGATELNLGLNRIGAEGSKTLGEALKQNETLQTLKLWGNNIGDEGGKALGEALKQNKTLLELDLGNNNIGAEGGKALGEALKQNETLQALFLGLNRIGAEGGKALGEALKQNKTLQALFLYNNDIGAEGGKALGEALKQNETLLELDLGKNNIGAEGGKALGEALKQNETLLELRLGDNNIGAEGGKALGEALKQNKTLQSLDLRWNNIGAEGAKALGEALKQNKTLQWLNLDGNNIGDEGAKALGEALKQNKTLQWLNLHNNDIGDEGGKALGEALKQNKTLQTLALWRNNIGDEGAKALGEALKQNKTLWRLILRSNNIGAEGGKALGEALKQNKTLQWLNLEDNDIDGSTFREIEAALARNRANPPQRHDDAWMEAIKAAINEGDEHAWGRAKLMVVGRGAAGKTSTVRSLLGQTPVMEHNSTEVADLLRTNAQHWQALSSDHGEFDAQARYAALRRLQEAPERKSLKRKSLARRASEAAQSLVSAATGGRLSASKSPARLEAAAASAPAVSMPSAHKALVDEEELTRKFALRDEDQAVLQGAAQAEARDVSFTIWDYGGQKVFYALHHIFLTDKGLYLVVFDMREIVGKEHFRDLLTLEEYQKLSTQAEAIAFLRFWLHSIRLHAPEAPVLMIGTFLDQVTQLREVNRVLREQVSATLHKHLVKPPKRGDLFFAIDNSSNDKDRAAELRTAIASVASEQRYVREQVPLAWLKLHEDMLQSCEPYMLYDEVVERAAEYGRPRTDVDAMLAYFHGLGVVVHLRGSQTLEHVVVIDAEWLLKKLARVIADDLHAQPLFSDPDLESAGLLPAYERLRKDMIATRSLLEWLWADQEVDYLLQFMEANMLLCPWRFDEHRDEDEFLVSGLLSDSIQQVETRKFKRGLTCELDFSSFFLPNGVFHRLVAQCATYATQRDAATSRSLAPRPPKLDAQTAKVFFGRDSFLMEVRGDAIQITVSATAKRPARVIKLLVSMFREQAETVFCGLEWRLLLHSPTTGARVSYHELTRARDNGSEELWAVDEEDDVADVADFDPFFVEQIGALDTDEDGADVARVPGVPSLGPNEDTHVFLSHVQSTGGDLAGILRLKLENRGLDVWFDQSYRDNLNQQAMLDGVRRTHTYVLVLTKGIFESSAVLEELRCARDSEKHIVVVHEADTHRASYASFGEYIASTPDFCDGFFLEEESLPVRRKWYEEEAFYNELVRRCFEQ